MSMERMRKYVAMHPCTASFGSRPAAAGAAASSAWTAGAPPRPRDGPARRPRGAGAAQSCVPPIAGPGAAVVNWHSLSRSANQPARAWRGSTMALDDRKLEVLRAIVEDYVETQEPV